MFLAEERESRARLEQIVAIAPRVQAGLSPEDAVVDVCRSARETFGADAAHVVEIRTDGFEVVHREPAHDGLPAGNFCRTQTSASYPAPSRSADTFVRDVPSTLEGVAYDAAVAAGTQTTLRAPIVVAGEPNRLLVLEWLRDLPEADPGFVALVRRFADQAGLALEHAERQEAQEEAVRRAEETRRLLRSTGALAGAATLDEVSNVILDRCRRTSAPPPASSVASSSTRTSSSSCARSASRRA